MISCVMKVLMISFALWLQIDAKAVHSSIIYDNTDESNKTALFYPPSQILPIIEPEFLTLSFDEVSDQSYENGKHFQGDMILTLEQTENLNNTVSSRSGVLSELNRWPKDSNGHVIVPYSVSETDGFSVNQNALISCSMYNIEAHTCIRFIERTTEEDFVYIFEGIEAGCSSNVGKIGGMQSLTLQKNGCFSRGMIIHELIHTLGYYHMHSHADRDKFVEINWQNIKEHVKNNFKEVDSNLYGNFGTDYDFYSVMHYSPKAFSSNGYDTIVTRNRRFRKIIGQRNGLSVGDVSRLNNMYNCKL